MDTLARPVTRRPRITLWLLRLVVTGFLLAVLAQPLLAGMFLTGDADALAVHSRIGGTLALGAMILVVTVALYVVGGRGRPWALAASVLMTAAVFTQIAVGHSRALGVHVPLGVAIVTTSVLLAIWVWTPGARRAR